MKKVRKPRALKLCHRSEWKIVNYFEGGEEFAKFESLLSVKHHSAKDCRRLAAWLLKAAAYLEQKGKK